MWHCAYACIEKRRHLNAKTTIVKFYICMDNCPQNKIDIPPPKKIEFIKNKCPCRNCIQRLHYPAFPAFFSTGPQQINSNLQTGLRSNRGSVQEKSWFYNRGWWLRPIHPSSCLLTINLCSISLLKKYWQKGFSNSFLYQPSVQWSVACQ